MQLSVLREPFDRGDLVTLMHDGERQTGVHTPAIDMERASTALSVIAAFLRSEHLKVVAQGIQQRDPGLEIELVIVSVDPQRDRNRTGNRLWSNDRSGGRRR